MIMYIKYVIVSILLSTHIRILKAKIKKIKNFVNLFKLKYSQNGCHCVLCIWQHYNHCHVPLFVSFLAANLQTFAAEQHQVKNF